MDLTPILLLAVPPNALAELIKLEKNGTIRHYQAKMIFDHMVQENFAQLMKAIELYMDGHTVRIVGKTTQETICVLTP